MTDSDSTPNPAALREVIARIIAEAICQGMYDYAEAVERMIPNVPPDADRILALPALAAVGELVEALAEAAEHFDNIARKAEHWRAVVANNEAAEARWAAVRNHARCRANKARAAIAKAQAQPIGEQHDR